MNTILVDFPLDTSSSIFAEVLGINEPVLEILPILKAIYDASKDKDRNSLIENTKDIYVYARNEEIPLAQVVSCIATVKTAYTARIASEHAENLERITQEPFYKRNWHLRQERKRYERMQISEWNSRDIADAFQYLY
jgi:hypothetical protein